MGYIVAFLLGSFVGTIFTAFMISAHSNEDQENCKTEDKD